MKKIFTLLCSALVGTASFAQIVPNGDFESGMTVWSGLNSKVISSLSVSSNGNEETLMPEGGAAFGILQNTTTTAALYQKFAYTSRPNTLRYMYSYLPAGQGEIAQAYVRFTKYNTTTMKVDTILSTSIFMIAGVYPWKEVVMDLSTKYKTTDMPDTAYVFFASSVSANRFQNTALVLDNIKLSSNGLSVKEIANSENSLVGKPTITPNPVKDIATISYQVNTACDVKIELYDITGKMVKEIANEKKLNFGTYTAQLDATNMKPGVYFYKISTGSYTTTEKIIISR